MGIGAIILCGGRSRRMGRSKALLPFGPERMLQRVVRLVGEACETTVVVARPRQQLPDLPSAVHIARDRFADLGPLEGIAMGLGQLPESVEAAYVTACDVPLLVPEFVRRMAELLGPHAIVVPHVGGFDHPLAAVYRRTVLAEVEALLAEGLRRPALLFERVPTRRVGRAELADVDPELKSLANLNSAEDYRAALGREV